MCFLVENTVIYVEILVHGKSLFAGNLASHGIWKAKGEHQVQLLGTDRYIAWSAHAYVCCLQHKK